MEKFLVHQVEKCDYYRQLFEQQGDAELSEKFATYLEESNKSLEILRTSQRNNENTPGYKYETVSFSSTPLNLDVRDKELQITAKVSNLSETMTYITGDFEFPGSKDESLTKSFKRSVRYAWIEPKRLCLCSNQPSQLDKVYSTTSKPFEELDAESQYYERPLSFFVDKGKSRTLKRKFKPIKLTFYEKTNFYRQDKKLGSIQVKVDSINEEVTTAYKLPLMNGRKKTDYEVEGKIKVREPLVEKTVRLIEEKFIFLCDRTNVIETSAINSEQ